jgi:hypothetical protein
MCASFISRKFLLQQFPACLGFSGLMVSNCDKSRIGLVKERICSIFGINKNLSKLF